MDGPDPAPEPQAWQRNAGDSVREYLRGLPAGRREIISSLRKLILKNLPDGYRESFDRGMINSCVPLTVHPDTDNGEPPGHLSLASRKHHLALSAMCLSMDKGKERWFRDAYHKSGRKPEMGKSCIRFAGHGDLPPEAIERLVAGTTVKELIALYEKSRR